MKLTTKSEYSLLALIYLARNGGKGYIKIEEICAAYKIPKKYLEQLFIALKKHHYVQARRGSNGGYLLARAPSVISLGEVFRLMDGALSPTRSVSRYFYAHTPLEKEPKAIDVLVKTRNFIAQLMDQTKLSDLL